MMQRCESVTEDDGNQLTSSYNVEEPSRLNVVTIHVEFTARTRSCGKVMFLQLSVILFKGGGCLALGLGVYTPGHNNLPPPAQSHSWTPLPGLTSPYYGKQAGGTHHTGMLSCFPFPFEQQPVSSQSHNILSAWDFPFPCVTLCLVSITNATLFSLVWISKLQTYRL